MQTWKDYISLLIVDFLNDPWHNMSLGNIH